MRTLLQIKHAITVPLHDIIADWQYRLVSPIYRISLDHTGKVRSELRRVLRYIYMHIFVGEARAIVVDILNIYCEI